MKIHIWFLKQNIPSEYLKIPNIKDHNIGRAKSTWNNHATVLIKYFTILIRVNKIIHKYNTNSRIKFNKTIILIN